MIPYFLTNAWMLESSDRCVEFVYGCDAENISLWFASDETLFSTLIIKTKQHNFH